MRPTISFIILKISTSLKIPFTLGLTVHSVQNSACRKSSLFFRNKFTDDGNTTASDE